MGTGLQAGRAFAKYGAAGQGRMEGSAALLKKRSKKLLVLWGMGVVGTTAPGPAFKVFLLLFVHKKKRLLKLPQS
jgi:hypothetical protein